MSKRMTKVLSMILTLVMFLSVSTPAFAWGNIGIGEGWDRDIGEDEVRDFDVDVEEEKEEYDYFSTFDEETGINVTVEAPMGALPLLAEVRVEPVDPEAVREAVDSVTEGEREILLAMDISFWLENDEIEPEEPVRVRIAAPELEGRSDLTVVHIPDEEEPESIDLITDENDLKFELGTNEICFESGDFSIYAVVGDDVISDSSRLTVNFIRKIGDEKTVITTLYVKNGDKYLENEEARVEGESYINDIVFDPGLGEGYDLGSNMFRGWTIDAADANPQPQPTAEDPDPDPIPYGANYDRNTKVYTIDDIDKFLAENRVGSIAEGDVLNIYAMVFQTYTISYFGASTDVSMGMHTVFAPLNENAQAPYTIDMTYTPEDNTHFFEGWMIMSGKENIVSAVDPQGNPINGPFVDINEQNPEADPPVTATVFPNGSKLVVKGNVQFSVSQPEGRWLIFKENGKGATYNAPQFVKSGEKTFQPTNALPANMVRNGYQFLGWYEVLTTMENGRAVPVVDEETGEYVFKSSTPFQFGNPLPQETIIAAKWQPRSDAQYTVVLWKQNLDGTGYDFWRAIPLTGSTGAVITGITQNGANVVDVNENGASRTTKNLKISGTKPDGTAFNEEISERGFHTGHYDTQDAELTIAAEGNTVVNVYYDRNIVQLNFWIYYSSAPILAWPGPGDPDLDDGGTYYCSDPDDGEDSTTVYQVYQNSAGEYVYNYPVEGGASINSLDGLTHSSGVNDTYQNTVYYFDRNGTRYWVWWHESTGWFDSSSWVYGTSANNYSELTARYIRNSNIVIHEYITEQRPAHSPYYYQAGTGWQRAAVIQGLYQSSLSVNGYAWPTTVNGNAYRWRESYSGSSATGTTTVLLDAFDTQNESMVTNFYGQSFSASCTIHFLTQNIDGTYTESGTAESTTGTFYLTDKFTGYHLTRYKVGSNGTTVNVSENQKKLDTENGQWYYDANPSTTAIDGVSYDTDLYVYFDRLSYKISYQDGTYCDGNDNPISGEISLGFIGESEEITFGEDISAYGDPNDTTHYRVPEHAGYVFEGWYADETCKVSYDFDTMPLGGVTVYAKWRQVQYRVFLHPNVPRDDETLFWGSDDQSMNFRMAQGDYVSTPTGTRTGYVFVGWYYDEDFDDVFDAERVPLTSDNVTAPYDKTATENMTDNQQTWTNPKTGKVENKPINKWGLLEPGDPGVNKDVNRFWITNKLDLYAKWKAILVGADGISVIYDEVPKGDDANASGHGVAGSAPTDGNRLYEDKSKAIAQPASTALAEDEHFLYWVVQKWNKTANAFVDVKEDGEIIKVYPGDNFMVRADYARITQDPDHTGKNFYTVQLRAAYGKKDGPEPTHIKWYSNIYDVAGNQFIDTETKGDMIHPTDATWNENGGWYIKQEDVQINKAVPIPAPPYSMEGYTFLGWGRVCDPESIPEGGKAYVTDPSTLTEKDLYIKWVPAANNIPAHYEAMLPAAAASGNVVPGNTRADGEELTWQTVQYVAADEQKPYHDMYAIWGGEFKVYHSGIEGGAVETYSLSRDNKTFDLTRYYTNTRAGGDEHTGEYKDAGFLYGGYYLEGGFKPAAYTEKTVGEGDAQKTIYIPTSTCAAYDGANWTWTTPVTDQPGNAITPKGGVTYYIKEVPADKYLQPYFHYTYKKGDTNPIVTAWLISDIDDAMYKETGFVIVHNENGTENKAYVCSQLTVQNRVGGAAVLLTPQAIFRAKDVTGGYLSYLEAITDYVNGPLKANDKVLQYWVTPDGLIVTGIAQRSYANLTDKATVKEGMSEDTVSSTINVFVAPQTEPTIEP